MISNDSWAAAAAAKVRASAEAEALALLEDADSLDEFDAWWCDCRASDPHLSSVAHFPYFDAATGKVEKHLCLYCWQGTYALDHIRAICSLVAVLPGRTRFVLSKDRATAQVSILGIGVVTVTLSGLTSEIVALTQARGLWLVVED